MQIHFFSLLLQFSWSYIPWFVLHRDAFELQSIFLIKQKYKLLHQTMKHVGLIDWYELCSPIQHLCVHTFLVDIYSRKASWCPHLYLCLVYFCQTKKKTDHCIKRELVVLEKAWSKVEIPGCGIQVCRYESVEVWLLSFSTFREQNRNGCFRLVKWMRKVFQSEMLQVILFVNKCL